MSRVARMPVSVPAGVEVVLGDGSVSVKGPRGALEHRLHPAVEVALEGSEMRVAAREGAERGGALAGTTRALVQNMVTGVSDGFERRLQLVGVGYRAQMKDERLNLLLGYSHPIDFAVPEGVSIETPSNTEIVVRGIDKQKVGQTAATIRGFRPPEPYKGKGVKYSDEIIVRKEAKKK